MVFSMRIIKQSNITLFKLGGKSRSNGWLRSLLLSPLILVLCQQTVLAETELAQTPNTNHAEQQASPLLAGKTAEEIIAWYQQKQSRLILDYRLDERLAVYVAVSRAYYDTRQFSQAESALSLAIDILRSTSNPEQTLLARLLNDYGLTAVAMGNESLALRQFKEAYEYVQTVDDPANELLIGLNYAKAKLTMRLITDLESMLTGLERLLMSMPVTQRTAGDWLKLGKLYRQGVEQKVLPSNMRLRALAAYQQALNTAGDGSLSSIDASLIITGDASLMRSYAYGYLGELYADEEKWDAAEQYSQKALFIAQKDALDSVLYRWQWQLARLYRSQDEKTAALEAYRQAVASLDRARALSSGIYMQDFHTEISPLYYELSNALLEQANEIEDKRPILLEAIDALEAVKVAEVEDYFDKQCVVLPEQQINLSEVGDASAVIYPVLLEDRIEVIVQSAQSIERFTTHVQKQQLVATVNEFRQLIERYDADHTYRASAEKLYHWLIQPAETVLKQEKIDTLVIVPDGPLRSIPLSALHDGQQFLIERFSFATTPGITLTDPKPLAQQKFNVLAYGLTEAVQGYSELPGVAQELAQIDSLYNTTLYQDNDYQLSTAEAELATGGFNVVHFATHGEFNSDHKKSFLLTYDGKLTMDSLESSVGLRRFSSEPIELLVLSACQTAVGDEQAALGLAGIALKAGARSAMATLWFINDTATSKLIGDFYRAFNEAELSKAQALRQAQLAMVQSQKYQHPTFWAPFLLIGNWQ